MLPSDVILVTVMVLLGVTVRITGTLDECPSEKDISQCLGDIHMQKDDLINGKVFGGASKTPLDEIPKYCRRIPSSFSCLRNKISTCPTKHLAQWTHYLNIDGLQRTMVYMCQNNDVWSLVQRNCTSQADYKQIKYACTREQILYAQLDMVAREVLLFNDQRATRCSNRRIDLYCDIKALNVTSCALDDDQFCAGLVNSLLRIDTDCTCDHSLDKGYCPPIIDIQKICNIPALVLPTFNPIQTTTSSKEAAYELVTKPTDKIDKNIVKSELTEDSMYGNSGAPHSLYIISSSQTLGLIFLIFSAQLFSIW
ncbi:uncharacterized protein LOC135500315 [Lineus longissimus]|uniref:uncharacterized protein LOC135500315 n=1 Tax=Lineus longissimus TaxID=88925 RepID=UPI002B4E3F9A